MWWKSLEIGYFSLMGITKEFEIECYLKEYFKGSLQCLKLIFQLNYIAILGNIVNYELRFVTEFLK